MKKILLLEDEKILVDMYQSKLEQSGFKVVTAFESKEALALMKKEQPDLIILDILLPRHSGIYFLEKLRQNKDKNLAQTPVVAFSNFDDPKAKEEAEQLGVKGYLIKTSYTPQQLVNKVTSYLK